MLPSTSMKRRRPSWVQLVWCRLLTVFVLLFAMPGVSQIVQEVVSIAVEVDCCDDCPDEDERNCPGTCGHCMCCPHPNALLAAPVVQPGGLLLGDQTFGWHSHRAYASGYRAPPFRPPAA